MTTTSARKQRKQNPNSKLGQARSIYADAPTIAKDKFIEALQARVDVKKTVARTYWHLVQKSSASA